VAKFVFLGRLQDVAGVPELNMPLDRSTALAAVLDRMPPDLIRALADSKIRVAVNGELVAGSSAELMIADGDEIAFLPPVSGG
jgi:molybdopterin converting factor small subunit